MNPLIRSVTCQLAVIVSALFLMGCATTTTHVPAAAGRARPIVARNNGAKLMSIEALNPGDYLEWSGGVNARGFASGKGITIYHFAGNPDRIEVQETRENGFSEGPAILTKFVNGKVRYVNVASQKRGVQVGPSVMKYPNATKPNDVASIHSEYDQEGRVHGLKEYRFVNGGRNVCQFERGKQIMQWDYNADGSRRPNTHWDTVEAMNQSNKVWHAHWDAQREAERRAQQSSSADNSLDTLLAGVADIALASSGSSQSTTSNPRYEGGSGSSRSGGSSEYGGSSGSGGSSDTGRITLSAYGTEESDVFRDSRGKTHQSRVSWGKGKEFGSKGEAKREANRKAKDMMMRANEYNAKDDQRKAEEKRRAAEKAERERQSRESLPNYKGIIPK